MTDLEALFLILAVVYFSQCISWVAPRAQVFSRNFRGHWIPFAPEIALNAWKIKAAIANPLPIFAGVVLTDPEPLAITAESVLAGRTAQTEAGSEDSAVLAWNEAEKFSSRGDYVLAGGKSIHRALSASEARRIAALLVSLRKQTGSRAATIEKELKRQLDVKTAHERVNEFHAAARWPGLFANALFAVLLVVVPVYIWVGVRVIVWVNLLLTTLLLISAITFSFRSAHRRLYPDDKDARFSETLTVALSPFAAMRAKDTLARNLLASFDTLAVASVLLPPAAFERFAGQSYRNLRFPLPTSSELSPAFLREFAKFQKTRDRHRAGFLKRHFGDVERFLRPPAPASRQSRSYCPRCHAQFHLESGSCSDCPGIELQSLSVSAAEGSPGVTA